MAIDYTSLLGLAKPQTGTESGTWGTVVNDEITTLVEQAIAGGVTVDVTAGNVTLTDLNGASDQSRNAILLITGTPGTSRNVIAPSSSKVYVVRNGSNSSIVLKGSATTGVTIPTGAEALCFWNGSDFEIGTTFSTIFDVDNLRLDGNTLSSTDTNGNIVIAPNGTGDVQLDADTVRVGDSNANATITTNGTGDLILNTNAGSSSSSITIQDAANGNIVLAPNGTGRVEVSGTSSNAGGINFYEDTDNGTNKALLTAPAALGSDITVTLPDITSTLGYRNIPPVGTKTGSYTLATTDVGEYVQVGTGGSITIPDATFAEGDAISIFNNTTGAITITCTITTAYIAGTDADKATVSLATRGVCTILFISSTVCVISGNVS